MTKRKAEIEDMVCEHSLICSRQAIGFFDLASEERENFRPVRHRLVRVDPTTGRKSSFLSAHAGATVRWTVPEARVFLRDLTEHATQPRFVYRHVWRVGDLAMWDNRTTMHRARRFNSNEVRDVRRTTFAGVVHEPPALARKSVYEFGLKRILSSLAFVGAGSVLPASST